MGSDSNSLDFVERDVVIRSVVEFCRARGGVRGDGLCAVDASAVFEIGDDTSRSKRVAARALGETCELCTSLHHAEHVVSRDGRACELPPAVDGLKERCLVVGEMGCSNIRVEVGLGVVVRRHLMLLSTLLVEPKRKALSVLEVVFHPHPSNSSHAREAVDHDPDESAVAKPCDSRRVDGVEKLSRLVGGEHRGLAARDDVPRSPNGVRWIGVELGCRKV